MFPTNVCFEKYNLKDRSPTLFKIWWAKLTPPMPALALNMHTIWSDLHYRVTGFVHAFSHIFFPSEFF